MSRALLVLVAVLAAAILGCDVHPLGTRDVELLYSNEDVAPIYALPRVKDRLERAGIHAGFDIDPRGLAVTVDAERADDVEHALAWKGGLSVYRIEAAPTLAPLDTRGLTPQTTDRAGNPTVQYFTGPESALLTAAETTHDGAHRFLYDASASPPRTRTVVQRPILHLEGNDARAERTRIVVPIGDAANVAELARSLGDEIVAFARGPRIVLRSSLRDCFDPRHGDAGKPVIVIPNGDDITAWKRARYGARLLGGRPLPDLGRPARSPLPTNVWLAFASIALPLASGLAWLVFVRRFDRVRPMPWRSVLATFGLGMLSAPLAGWVGHWLRRATPFLDPHVMTLDASPKFFPVTLAVYIVGVGVVEEGAKLLAASALANRRGGLDRPVDGVILAAAASIGFAVAENLDYFVLYRFPEVTFVGRSLICIGDHAAFGSIWGYALGKRVLSRKARLLPFFALAALLHGASDTFLAYEMPLAGVAGELALMVVFVAVLRKSLRWGSIDEVGDDAARSGVRERFPVGRPGIFVLCAITLMALPALLISSSAINAAIDEIRLGLSGLGIYSLLLLVFAAAAWVLTSTLPLDAVVDANGLTFAGTLWRWTEICGVTRSATETTVTVHTGVGDVRLGPGARSTLDALETAIRLHLPPEEELQDEAAP